MAHSTHSIDIEENILIRRPCDAVWDFTQDFSRRNQWDSSVIQAEVIQDTPRRQVKVIGRGFRCTFEYKAEQRPRHTSVIMRDVASRLVSGGGGSWRYEPRDDGCLWTQTMRIDLKPSWVYRLFARPIGRMMRRQLRKSMQCARNLIEDSPSQ